MSKMKKSNEEKKGHKVIQPGITIWFFFLIYNNLIFFNFKFEIKGKFEIL